METHAFSGYGHGGDPRAGYDQIVASTAGGMSLTASAGRPTKRGVPVGDLSAGMFAATAIVAALYERRSSGRGQSLRVAMQDSLVSMLTHHRARYLATGDRPVNDVNGHATTAPPYGLFAVTDGHVNTCVGNDAQFQRMCKEMDVPGWPGASGCVPTRSGRATRTSCRRRELTVAQMIERLEGAGVPVGAVSDLAEVITARRRQMLVTGERAGHDPFEPVNSPWKVHGRARAVGRCEANRQLHQ